MIQPNPIRSLLSQDPEGDSQSEEIGMADRLGNEMDEGSMDTDEEHDQDLEEEHPDHFSDDDEDDDEDDDDDDGGEVELLGSLVCVVLPAGALSVFLCKSGGRGRAMILASVSRYA